MKETGNIDVTPLLQVLETSDMPGGIVNILTGNRDHLTKYLTEHHDVQAMWWVREMIELITNFQFKSKV